MNPSIVAGMLLFLLFSLLASLVHAQQQERAIVKFDVIFL